MGIRCDQEAALKSLVSEVARVRGDAVTISEHCAVGDSQGNDFIERAVRTVEEMLRKSKLDLEGRISENLNMTHKVIPCMIEYAVDLVNKVQVSQDGKTSFERVKKKRFNRDNLRFANPVMIRVAAQVQGGVMFGRWFEGWYMGLRFHTNEAIVMRLSDGVMVRTRSIQRQKRDVTMEMLNKLVGVPWDPTGVVRARADGGHDDGGYVTSGQISSEDGSPETRERTPRSMYITSDLIQQYGPTAGCPKCRSVARRDSISQTLPHSRACRERVEGLVGHDPLSRDRLSRAKEGKNALLCRTP